MTRTRYDDTTSNLLRHVQGCGGETGSESLKNITAFAHGSRYTPARLRYKLALWITRRHRPFSIVEDPELIGIFQDFNNKVMIPSCQTLTRDIHDIFEITRKSLAGQLQNVEGKFHLIIEIGRAHV